MTTDKIYLVGFMASGKSTIARALARAPALARRGHRRSHRAARAADDRRDLRDARRAVLPRRRARDAARSLQPLRHVVVATGGGTFADPDNRAAINLDGVSVWIDVPLADLIPRIPLDGRRPLAAEPRASSSGCTPRASTRTAWRTSASPRRACRAAAIVDRILEAHPPAAARSSNARSRPPDAGALSHPQRHPRQPARARRRARRRRGDRLRPGARASAISSATAPIPAPVIDRTLALEPVAIIRGNHDKVVRGPRAADALQRRGARGRSNGRPACSTPAQLQTLAELPQGPALVDRRARDLPRRAVRRGPLRLRRRRRRARDRRRVGAASACSATRICPPSSRRRTIRRRPATDLADDELRLPKTRPGAHQRRVGRPAARRRSARGLRPARHRQEHDPAAARGVRHRRRAAADSRSRTAGVAGDPARTGAVTDDLRLGLRLQVFDVRR